jgi:hypothetical protein
VSVRGLALAALAASVALAGCGAQAVEDAPSLDEVAAATRADPYRFELTMKSDSLSESFTATASGAADPAADRGVIRYAFADDGEKMTLEVRRLDGTTYTRFTGSELGSGWGKETTAEADEAIGPFGMFSEPHRAVDALARHGEDVEAEPGEPIDGVTTTHYRATVRTIEILGAALKDERRDELEVEIRKTDSETAQVDAWAGADGLLRKLDLEIPINEDGDRGRVLTSARFYDFGTRVDVEAPPAAEMQEGISGLSKPCSPAGAPHSAEKVMAALREQDFTVSASCVDTDTSVYAFRDNTEDAVACFIASSPRTREDGNDAIVAGNVSCYTETAASRKLVQRLLRGL